MMSCCKWLNIIPSMLACVPSAQTINTLAVLAIMFHNCKYLLMGP